MSERRETNERCWESAISRRTVLRGGFLGAAGLAAAALLGCGDDDAPAARPTPTLTATTAPTEAPAGGDAATAPRVAAPFEGAWQWLSAGNDGRLLLTERHSCAVFGSKDRPPPPDGELDEAEAARLFRTFSGPFATSFSTVEQEGEWSLDGTVLIAAQPANVGAPNRGVLTVDGDEMRGGPFRYRRLSAPGASPLAGVWQLESDAWDGIMLMTDSHYCYQMQRKDRPFVAGITTAEELYHAFDARGGSYAVEGATLVRIPELAKDPREQGQEIALEFSLDSGLLITRTAAGKESLWRKLD